MLLFVFHSQMQVEGADCLPLTSEHDNLFCRVVDKRYRSGVMVPTSNLTCRVGVRPLATGADRDTRSVGEDHRTSSYTLVLRLEGSLLVNEPKKKTREAVTG
jgi:hypothetical protein